MRAGQLNRRVHIQRRVPGRDAFGQPVQAWEPVGDLWAGITGESGLGAIRAAAQENVPVSIARYSFLVRFAEAKALEIDQGMRVVHDGMIFDIKGVTRDLRQRDRAYLICEQGGSDG